MTSCLDRSPSILRFSAAYVAVGGLLFLLLVAGLEDGGLLGDCWLEYMDSW